MSGDAFDRCLANFLDEFYAAPNAAALAESPVLLASSSGETGRVQDAYLAATAEDLPAPINFLPGLDCGRARANCTNLGSPRRWPRYGPCCFWKVRPPSAHAIFSSAKMR